MPQDRPFSSISRTATGPTFWCRFPSKAAWRDAVRKTLSPPLSPDPATDEGTADQLGIGQRALRHSLGKVLKSTEKGTPRLAAVLWEARTLRWDRHSGTIDAETWDARRDALLALADELSGTVAPSDMQ